MILARIVGTVVATRKDPRLVSTKLLVVGNEGLLKELNGKVRAKRKKS